MKFTPYSFQKLDDRPFFFTSFVGTIDGKIIVKEKGYWPIGSKDDYDYFTWLRAHADAIVDAKNTALMFGKYTIKTIHDATFQKYRRELGKQRNPEYIVLTSHPTDELHRAMSNDFGYEPTILTPQEGEKRVTVSQFVTHLLKQGHEYVFVDGGPTLIAQLLQEKVLDEVHLTIAPKIFGSAPGKTLTMTEGILFPPQDVPEFSLLGVERLGDEVVLRYKWR